MRFIILTTLFCGILALGGCSTEKTPEPSQKVTNFVLAPSDKDKLLAFHKEILNIETLTDMAVNLAVNELKNVIKGETGNSNLSSIIDKAKVKCLIAGDLLNKKAVPESLSPETTILLNDGRAGLIAAYKTYAESFDIIKGFIFDKNPMALLEYRKKNAQAQKLYAEAAEKINRIMAAGGVTK